MSAAAQASSMFAVGVVVLLCFTSVGDSAPPACEDLVRPLDQIDLNDLEGRRALIAGTLNNESYLEKFKERDSGTLILNHLNEVNMTLSRSMRLHNQCHYMSYNISLNGSSFSFDNGRVMTTFISTSCHDCLLMSFDVESGKRHHLYLYSRRRQLELKELEHFRAQVECLQMPPPAVMNATKELCPEETPLRHI